MDATRLDRREQAVERDVVDLHGFARTFGHFVDQVNLEADDLARGVLELPGYVAHVGPDHPIGGHRCAARYREKRQRQARREVFEFHAGYSKFELKTVLVTAARRRPPRRVRIAK